MQVQLDMQDFLFVIGSFTCVAVPLVLLVFFMANYRIVEKKSSKEKFYDD